jgi:hypothetical protein
MTGKMVTARDGRKILVIGTTVYWDPKVFGVSAEDVMPMARHFVTYDGTSYFLKDSLVAHFLDDASAVIIEAEIHGGIKNV